MKVAFKKFLKSIRFANTLIEKRIIQNRYKHEIRLLENKSLPGSGATSCIHFSLNKAATQHIKRLLFLLSLENNLIPIDIHGYAFSSNIPYFDSLSEKEMESYRHVFRRQGYMYSVFGGFVDNISQLEKYKVLLTIRDPRDILVSGFFSMAYSHTLPSALSDKRENFESRRKQVQDQTIDDFVIEESGKLLKIYQRYFENLVNKNLHLTILKYEEMVTDYDMWLNNLLKGCGFRIKAVTKSKLLDQFKKTTVNKENKYSHLRKGVAGDYKEKLKPETIKYLNDKFSVILKKFEYEV